MGKDKPLYEIDENSEILDPDAVPASDRKVVTQPYDLVVQSLLDQIRNNTMYLRPISERPSFQRRYVWTDKLASRLIESILLKVPIPPCYLSQNDDFELDVIDGQQRLFSIYRFTDNRFRLSDLEILTELNGAFFYQLSSKTRRQLNTHTLRCILITNESHPEIKFDVFERLNTNTVPLNSQEIRNCIFRGVLNDFLKEAVVYEPWLQVLGRKTPDKRMRDEELVLRFCAFQMAGLSTYRTPLKHWLNEVAKKGRNLPKDEISRLRKTWKRAVDVSLEWFNPEECFRRLPLGKSKAINRALYDLVMNTASRTSRDHAAEMRSIIRRKYLAIIENEEFQDLIGRSVDHTRRTKRRFEIWELEFGDLM